MSVLCPVCILSIVHVELIDYCVLRGLKEENKIWIIFSVINSDSCFCLLYHVWVKVLILYVKCFSSIIEKNSHFKLQSILLINKVVQIISNIARCQGNLITLVTHLKHILWVENYQSVIISFRLHIKHPLTVCEMELGSHCVLEKWWYAPQSSRTPGPRVTTGTALPSFNL